MSKRLILSSGVSPSATTAHILLLLRLSVKEDEIVGVCRLNVMLLNKAYIKICETFHGIYKFFIVQYSLCCHDNAAGNLNFRQDEKRWATQLKYKHNNFKNLNMHMVNGELKHQLCVKKNLAAELSNSSFFLNNKLVWSSFSIDWLTDISHWMVERLFNIYFNAVYGPNFCGKWLIIEQMLSSYLFAICLVA